MSNKITIGVTDLSFHHVAASLVYNVLSEMGFNVERVYSPHQDNFAKLKSGEIDMLSSAWLPSSHGIYKSDVETVEPLLELGLHYEPYALWGVPDYVPEDAVSQVSDLLKPDVFSRMNKNIQGITPGAGITRFSIKMMEEYGLNNLGYSFHTGNEEDCFSAFETAVNKKEWIIIPLWQPQFLHHNYQIRTISEPKGLLGTVDRAVLLLRQDRSKLFTQTQLEQLDTLRFLNEIISALDHQASREAQPLDAVTSAWLKHQM
ncbi:glycine betaine ABC transporter substrate-binding protein [Shewanella eurypsychrophilus]|uniref:Glycine betaine ABC transporter substrate-binding protein n=2 Tax=Shewanellaceae TaxID=267890 RepID=A0ABX6VCI6_9GAMM|nr:glycine/betaine ABC transporter [Shewanella sp. YLB-09]QPG60404.1 glycine betaine ABC transporter substrate-binding protein [Shewanella eurypsychrophilus]